jgi:predicted nucleic acid-binding protein
MFLIDTGVIVETRKRKPDPKVMAWLKRADPAAVHVSVLSLAEIASAAARLARRDAAAGTALLAWLLAFQARHDERVVGIDAEIALLWGRLAGELPLPVVDGLLLATAHVRKLTLVTRAIRAATRLGVPVLDPWQG